MRLAASRCRENRGQASGPGRTGRAFDSGVPPWTATELWVGRHAPTGWRWRRHSSRSASGGVNLGRVRCRWPVGPSLPRTMDRAAPGVTRRPAKLPPTPLPPRPARPGAARPPPQRGRRRPACPDQATPRTPDVAAGHGERRPVPLRLPLARGAQPTAPDVRTGPAGRKGGRGRRRHRDGERLPAMPDLSSPARWCREAAAGTGRVRRRRLSPTRRRETRPRRKADGLHVPSPPQGWGQASAYGEVRGGSSVVAGGSTPNAVTDWLHRH